MGVEPAACHDCGEHHHVRFDRKENAVAIAFATEQEMANLNREALVFRGERTALWRYFQALYGIEKPVVPELTTNGSGLRDSLVQRSGVLRCGAGSLTRKVISTAVFAVELLQAQSQPGFPVGKGFLHRDQIVFRGAPHFEVQGNWLI